MPNKYEDNEELWLQAHEYSVNEETGKTDDIAMPYFRHAELSSLFRIIDVKNQTITFVDTARISKISDINLMLRKDDDPERNKRLYFGLCNRVLHEVSPIEMPYTPDGPTAYIETFPGYLGVLYFKDNQDNMIEAKKFFKGPGVGHSFEEISYHDYILAQQEYYEKEIKEIEDAVANGSNKESSGEH